MSLSMLLMLLYYLQWRRKQYRIFCVFKQNVLVKTKKQKTNIFGTRLDKGSQQIDLPMLNNQGRSL